MLRLQIKAYAKVNLTLDVLYKRPDGFHEIETIMQSINWYDVLELSRTDGEVTFFTESTEVPSDQRNLAWRAAVLLKEEAGCCYGAYINLKKFIPVAAGLAGGSADAAAVLIGLNRIWKLGFSRHRLAFIGKNIGSDVPFCVFGGTALARGRGERITPLKVVPRLSLVLVKPAFGLSTAEVYRKFSGTGPGGKRDNVRVDTKGMIRAIESGDSLSVARLLANTLEKTAIQIRPEIALIKKSLLRAGALGAVMSGSGPTVFGIFENHEQAKMAVKKLVNYTGELPVDVQVTKTLYPENNLTKLLPVSKE